MPSLCEKAMVSQLIRKSSNLMLTVAVSFGRMRSEEKREEHFKTGQISSSSENSDDQVNVVLKSLSSNNSSEQAFKRHRKSRVETNNCQDSAKKAPSLDTTFMTINDLSLPFRNLVAYDSDKQDFLDYVWKDDKVALISQVHDFYETLPDNPEQGKFLCRLITTDGKEPVVTYWNLLVSNPESDEKHIFVVEITSLVPKMRLAKEKALREKLCTELHEKTNLLTTMTKVKARLEKDNERYSTAVQSLSVFPKVLSNHKNILLWKVNMKSRRVTYISSVGCDHLLKYNRKHIIDHMFVDTVHDDDLKKAEKLLSSEVSTSLRRYDKFGKVVWLESLAFKFQPREDAPAEMIIVEAPSLTNLFEKPDEEHPISAETMKKTKSG